MSTLDSKTWRQVMGHFATGVTVITTGNDGDSFTGFTANSLTSLSADPPLLLFCIDKRADTLPVLRDTRTFGVNILSEAQEELSRTFASSDKRKFDFVSFRLGRLGVPLIDGSIAHIECRVAQFMDGGDHIIVIGQPEAIKEEDVVSFPLLFHRGRYLKRNTETHRVGI